MLLLRPLEIAPVITENTTIKQGLLRLHRIDGTWVHYLCLDRLPFLD